MGILSFPGKKMKINFMSVKVSIFEQDQTTIAQEDPKGFTWHKH